MTVSKLTISYPDFQLNTTIDPEQFDVNNLEVVTKANELIEKVNDLDINKANTADLAIIQNNLASMFQGAIASNQPVYKTFVDEASLDTLVDVYTYGGLRDETNKLLIDFTLSNKVNGQYLTKTYRTYATDGVTVALTTVRTLTYHANGVITEG